MSGAQSAATRPAGTIQAVVLLTTSGLAAMVTAVLGPAIPRMQQHFADVPHADYWVPLTLTAPMLMMAALSMMAGALSDRVGRKRLLVGSTFGYAVVGTAPLYLNALSSIVMSRIGLGVMEAVLMTISTTMIGDYFAGPTREKYMALQTTIAASLAFLLNLAGGFLGEFGWRVPFGVYAIGVPLAMLMAVFLWEPIRRGADGARVTEINADDTDDTDDTDDVVNTVDTVDAGDARDGTFQPLLLAQICALAFLCGIGFLIVPIHLGYLFAAIGVHTSAQVGVAFAFDSLGVILGTLCFGWWVAPRVGVANQLGLCFSISGLGCLLMMGAKTYLTLTVAASINGFGTGLMLPTLVTWNMRELPFVKRGLGTGAFQSSLFLGMFVNPVVVVALDKAMGGRAVAVGLTGAALLLIASMAVAVGQPSLRARYAPRSRIP